MHPNDIAYCGLYCPMCAFRVAHETGDRRHLTAMPARYDAMKDSPLSECACAGCRVDGFCGPCAIKDCAAAKNLLTCADCPDFPCAHTDAFAGDGVPHHREAIEHLHTIRRDGYEAWLTAMRAKAQNAAGRNSWYYEAKA